MTPKNRKLTTKICDCSQYIRQGDLGKVLWHIFSLGFPWSEMLSHFKTFSFQLRSCHLIIRWYFSGRGSTTLKIQIEYINFSKMWSLRGNDIHIYSWDRGGAKQKGQKKLMHCNQKRKCLKQLGVQHSLMRLPTGNKLLGISSQSWDSSIMWKYILMISSRGWLVHFAALQFGSFRRKWKHIDVKT